jgi:hypothetical protein
MSSLRINHHHYFGALDGEGRYVLPWQGHKENKYTCWECNENLILKCGEIRVWHFSHLPKSRCQSYTNPSESQIHRHAKQVLKMILENKLDFQINHLCKKCHKSRVSKSSRFRLQESHKKIEVEKSFIYRGCQRRADIAIWDSSKNEAFCIFEIFHTHKTDQFYRPKYFWDLKASDIFEIYDRTKQVIKCHKPLCFDCHNEQIHMRYVKEINKYRDEVSSRLSEWRKSYEEELSRILDDMSKDFVDVLNKKDVGTHQDGYNEIYLIELINLQKDLRNKLPIENIFKK